MTSPEDTIRTVFQNSLDRLLDNVPNAEAEQIQIFCEALAAFRPFIPIEVLSIASGMPVAAIRSFVTDLGQPLSIRGDAIQFFDEPSETWFRETYKPKKNKLVNFIIAIKPLASTNSYVASALPQLLLEAGKFDQLVDLVLSNQDLPSENSVDRRNISLQRLQFALKAALRDKRYKDAAQLALKAGGETAGDDRQRLLIQANTDIVSRLLPDHQLLEMVARKNFSGNWYGSHHAYEAGLLSGCERTIFESRSYLRLAHRWVQNWSRLTAEERKQAAIQDEDIAEMVLAQLNIHGAEALVKELESWKPNQVAYRVGSIVFSRLVDLGRFDELNEIARVSNYNLCIQLALIQAQNPILRYPSSEVVNSALNGIKKNKKLLQGFDNKLSHKEQLLSVVTSTAQAAAFQKSATNAEIVSVLEKYIPNSETYYFSRIFDELRFTIVRANCLRAALAYEKIELFDLASSKLRGTLEKSRDFHDQDAREFLEDVGAVFPWHQLWAKALLGNVKKENLAAEIEGCLKSFRTSVNIHHRDDRPISKEISRLWIEILLLVDTSDKQMEIFTKWKNSLNQPLFVPDLTHLVRIFARSVPFLEYTFCYANEAYDLIANGPNGGRTESRIV